MRAKIFVLLSFVGTSVLIMGCGSNKKQDYHLDSTTFDRQWLDRIARDTGMTIPDGCRGLNMFYQGSTRDPSFVAKIEVPSPDHEILAKQLEAFTDIQGGAVTNPLTKKVPWWRPSVGLVVETEKTYYWGTAVVNVALCRQDEQWLLYVHWLQL